MRGYPAVLMAIAVLSILSVCNIAFAQEAGETEFILDLSGNMSGPVDKVPKIDAVKKALVDIANQITPESRVGLRVFGGSPAPDDGSASSLDSKFVVLIKPFEKEEFTAAVEGLKVADMGRSPIGYSLKMAATDFSTEPRIRKTVILITGGKENCGVPSLDVIETLKQAGRKIIVYVVGFAVDEAGKEALANLAAATNGAYFDAKDAKELKAQLSSAVEEAGLFLRPKKVEGGDILAASAGCRIVSASKKAFAHVIDGSNEPSLDPLEAGDEVVFAFKDDKEVLLEKFAVPIFEENDWNPGRLKLYGSRTAPDKGFFPITTINVKNKVFFDNVYQEFPINPPVAVKYLKVVVGLSSGSDTLSYHREWRAYGKYLKPD